MYNRLEKKMYNGWLAAPGFLIFIVIYVIPTLSSFYFGFTTWNLKQATWTGLDNFVQFFTMYNTKFAIPNTLKYTAIETVITVVGGLILAVFLTSGLRSQGYLKAIIFLPTLLGSVVVASAWSSLMDTNGLLNQVLGLFGVEPVKWLTSKEWALASCIIVQEWQGMGTALVIYIGGLSAIPQTYYEAAAMDGVNPWTKFFKITLPLMVPSINTVLTLSLIGGFKNYDLIYSLAGSGPAYSTEVLGSAVFKLFSVGHYGIATTGYIVIFLVACLIVLPLNHWVAKREAEL